MTARKRGIAGALSASNLALALLPLAASGTLALTVLASELRRSAERAFADAAALVTSQVSILLTTPARLVSVAAKRGASGPGAPDPEAPDAFLRWLKEGYPAFARLDAFDAEGRVKATYPPEPERIGDSAIGRDFYRLAAAGADVWSSVFIDSSTGAPMVAVASPGLGGVLAGYVDLSELGLLVSALVGRGGAYATVVDADGIFIAHPQRERVARRESARLIGAIAGARIDGITSSIEEEGGRRYLCAARKEPISGWTVALFLAERDLYEPARLLLAAWALILLATAAAAALFAAGMARKLARPFLELARFAEEIGEGEYGGKAPEAPFRELAGMAAALASSAAKVSQREAELRSAIREREALAREIQHRVKNNLSVLLGLISLAEQDSPPEAQGFIEGLRGRVHAMSAVHELSYSSGSYSRIDAARYLGTIIESALGKGGRIESRLACESLSLPVDAAVPLGLAANELLVNAAKHAYPKGGRGLVRVSLSRAGQGLRLVVSDDGRGLPEGGAEGERGGTGLELVELLAGQLRGRLSLGRSPAGGLEASIDFPELGEGRAAERP